MKDVYQTHVEDYVLNQHSVMTALKDIALKYHDTLHKDFFYNCEDVYCTNIRQVIAKAEGLNI